MAKWMKGESLSKSQNLEVWLLNNQSLGKVNTKYPKINWWEIIGLKNKIKYLILDLSSIINTLPKYDSL